MPPGALGRIPVYWLPVFEAGKYLIAFDGAALLLLEFWRRQVGFDRSGR